MSMNLAIENKNNTSSSSKMGGASSIRPREVVVVFLFRLGACVSAWEKVLSMRQSQNSSVCFATARHVVVRASTSVGIYLNFVQTLNFRYSFFFIISWWWITHVADELCRVPTKQSFVCVDSLLHRKSSVLSLCAPCYFYLLATSEFRSTSGYTSKFFSKLVLSASLLWCVIWPKSIKSV